MELLRSSSPVQAGVWFAASSCPRGALLPQTCQAGLTPLLAWGCPPDVGVMKSGTCTQDTMKVSLSSSSECFVGALTEQGCWEGFWITVNDCVLHSSLAAVQQRMAEFTALGSALSHTSRCCQLGGLVVLPLLVQ